MRRASQKESGRFRKLDMAQDVWKRLARRFVSRNAVVIALVVLCTWGVFHGTGRLAHYYNSGPTCPVRNASRDHNERREDAQADTLQLVNTTDRNFTIVTSFFNLGVLRKGGENSFRKPEEYMQWMRPFRYIRNGVVAFFDDPVHAAAFNETRANQLTEIVIVNRSELWAFSMLQETGEIFAQPDYPKNFPKSTSPAYVSVMHAKSELMARVVHDNPFGSLYFAWVDMGIYRELPNDATDEFTLTAPRCLCDNSIMFGRVHDMANTTVEDIMRTGLDWVAGGLFIARADTMLQFCADYRRYTERLLKMGLANHDQSVLYSMYLPKAEPRPVVPMQTTRVNIPEDPFFYLALQMRRLALAGVEPDRSCLRTSFFT